MGEQERGNWVFPDSSEILSNPSMWMPRDRTRIPAPSHLSFGQGADSCKQPYIYGAS